MNKTLQNSMRFLTVIKLCLVVLVFFTAVGYHSVGSATCSAQTNFTCEDTDYTSPTCNTSSLTCDCKEKYVPIPTGCTAKLAKPYIVTEEGRTLTFLPGTPVKLTCGTSDNGTLTFVWKKGGNILQNDTKAEYQISGTDAAKVGKYRCLVQDTSASLTSDESDEVDIQQANTSKVTPTVDETSIPTVAAPGAVIDVRCKDIPYGSTYKISIDSGTPVQNVTHSSTIKKVECVLDTVTGVTFTNSRSASAVWLTQDAIAITKVDIVKSTDNDFKTGATVTLTCETEPEAMYMEAGNSKISYTFEVNGNQTATTRTYTVTSIPGVPKNLTVSCNASYGINQPVKSAPIKLTFSDNYITSPILKASNTQVKLGSRLFLTCGVAQTGVTYTWMKDGTTIARQFDRIIQFGNFRATDAGKFSCTAKYRSYLVNSNDVVVRSNAFSLQVLSSTLLLLAAFVSHQTV